MDKDFLDELNKLDTGGVLAYTLLLFILEECEDDADRRREVAIRLLPSALLCALQDQECLQDIKNVGEKFPELLPLISTHAIKLRGDKSFRDWTKYESANYREYISSIVNPKP
ncbi:MAG: hypothetical protein HW402_321 [Dehalococcoidales bacterium]|nr:hypothetical protein [Dehalococcoidales bacterium]